MIAIFQMKKPETDTEEWWFTQVASLVSGGGGVLTLVCLSPDVVFLASTFL